MGCGTSTPTVQMSAPPPPTKQSGQAGVSTKRVCRSTPSRGTPSKTCPGSQSKAQASPTSFSGLSLGSSDDQQINIAVNKGGQMQSSTTRLTVGLLARSASDTAEPARPSSAPSISGEPRPPWNGNFTREASKSRLTGTGHGSPAFDDPAPVPVKHTSRTSRTSGSSIRSVSAVNQQRSRSSRSSGSAPGFTSSNGGVMTESDETTDLPLETPDCKARTSRTSSHNGARRTLTGNGVCDAGSELTAHDEEEEEEEDMHAAMARLQAEDSAKSK